MVKEVKDYYVMISDFGTQSCLKIYLSKLEFDSFDFSIFIENGYALSVIKELNKDVQNKDVQNIE